MSKTYIVDGKHVQFDNERFRQALYNRHAAGKDRWMNAGCLYLLIDLKKNYKECDITSPKTILGWLQKNKRGRYSGPQQAEVIPWIAEALGVETSDLLCEVNADRNVKVLESKRDTIIMDACDVLLRVVASYKDSCGYFYHGDDDAEADNYWLDQIEEAKKMIQKAPHSSKTGDRLALCQEMHDFVQSYAYADGLPDHFYQVNPKLKFFASPHAIIEDSMETFVNANVTYRFIPSYQEIVERYNYFKAWEIDETNEEDYFMKELAETVQKIYGK